MCKDCGWEESVDAIDAALRDAEAISEGGEDFADSVSTKLRSMKDWIEENHHVTGAQETAIANMADGIQRWL